MCRLGKLGMIPLAGALMSGRSKGLGGTRGADLVEVGGGGGGGRGSGNLLFLDFSWGCSSRGSCLTVWLQTSESLHEHSEAVVEGAEFGVVAPDEGAEDGALVGEKTKPTLFPVTRGELRDMKRRKSA